MSKRTVAKLMTQNGIRPPRGKRRVPLTTDSRHAHAVAPNMLDRNFEIAVPDTVWLADISYIPTDEGWLYLAAVKDLATRWRSSGGRCRTGSRAPCAKMR